MNLLIEIPLLVLMAIAFSGLCYQTWCLFNFSSQKTIEEELNQKRTCKSNTTKSKDA